MKKKREFYSMIATPLHVSESEIAVLYPQYDVSWLVENIEDLKAILYSMGGDTSKHFELQEVTQHRNRLGNVVTCGRYLLEERSDPEWLKSGYASQAAIDKSRNSPMTDCLYRVKGLTTDMQDAMEVKDKYKTLEDESGFARSSESFEAEDW